MRLLFNFIHCVVYLISILYLYSKQNAKLLAVRYQKRDIILAGLWARRGECGGREVSRLQQIKIVHRLQGWRAATLIAGPVTPYIDSLVYFNVRPSPHLTSPHHQYNDHLARAERICPFHQLLIFHLGTIWTSAGGHKNVQFTTKVTIKSWDSARLWNVVVLID